MCESGREGKRVWGKEREFNEDIGERWPGGIEERGMKVS